MKYRLFDPTSKRRPTNVSVNKDLLDKARASGINLSRVLEQALTVELRGVLREQWLRENRQAIEDYNDRVARRGVFSNSLRRF